MAKAADERKRALSRDEAEDIAKHAVKDHRNRDYRSRNDSREDMDRFVAPSQD